MRHTSIKLDTPCEFINVTPINPLISKCEIKVCYVSDEPNRNKSIITKEVATQMANSLPGSPIVGFYNETSEDFEEHNRIIDISNGKFEIKDTTRPYGFVDLNAKVWFQKFLDDGEDEREYLMTEGYLWTEQYSEAKRILEKGNNQSMELDPKTLNATWSKDENGIPQFFIINEAIISKLCILGDNEEPCFEGATITEPRVQFSFDDSFKEQLFSMMNELKELIKEGGTPVFTTFAVEVGDALWSALYDFIEETFPRDLEEGEDANCYRCSKYWIDSIWEEGSQKFVILRERNGSKMFRMNFSWNDDGFASDAILTEVEKTYVPVAEEPVFALADIEAFENKIHSSQDNSDEENNENPDNTSEGNENPVNEGQTEPEQEPESEKIQYTLEEIPEYIELLNKYSALENDYSALKIEKEALDEKIAPLAEFKAQAEKKEKQAMIDSFYMLSDEDKSDVLTNIDTYSVDDIEAKLSIICVRNKVSFNLSEDEDSKNGPTTYNLDGAENNSTPAWIKSLQNVAKNMK